MINRIPKATLGLIGLILVSYFIQLAVPDFTSHFIGAGYLYQQEPYRLLTSIFLHSTENLGHLVNNLLFLLLVGWLIESRKGSTSLILVFMITGLVSQIATIPFYLNDNVLGSSGAISGMMGYVAVLWPTAPLLSMGIIMPAYLAVALWIIINALLPNLPGIATMTHVTGALLGVFLGILTRKKNIETKSIEDQSVTDEELDHWERKYLR